MRSAQSKMFSPLGLRAYTQCAAVSTTPPSCIDPEQVNIRTTPPWSVNCMINFTFARAG